MLFSLVVTYTMILAHRHMENTSEILAPFSSSSFSFSQGTSV